MKISLSLSSLTATQIAKMYGCSASSVIRHCHPKYRVCFDEFRSTGRLMSFICCDSAHKVIVKLPNLLTKTINNYFFNSYNLSERQQVETVIDLNA